MSLQIIKAGILDTIQDHGRFSFQHLGINISGAMDQYSFQLSNALLGKELNTPVIEMHFPASQFVFNVDTIFVLTGADFSPTLNGKSINLNQPVIVTQGGHLNFEKVIKGARCYLSIVHSLQSLNWLGSCSTNFRLEAGGHLGRRLIKNDVINFTHEITIQNLKTNGSFKILPWGIYDKEVNDNFEFRFVEGNEWNMLKENSKEQLLNQHFTITPSSDRMGYKLNSLSLEVVVTQPLISSAVTFGTIQLLPNGQLVILMADHQTTGGYPRIGHILSADLPSLAQKKPGDTIHFVRSSHNIGWQANKKQQLKLEKIRKQCESKINKFII